MTPEQEKKYDKPGRPSCEEKLGYIEPIEPIKTSRTIPTKKISRGYGQKRGKYECVNCPDVIKRKKEK